MKANTPDRLRALTVAAVCDVDRSVRVLDPRIRPIRDDLKLVGRAHTVSCENDFLTVLDALRHAEAGEVLVVDAQGSQKAVAGGLFASEAARRGLAGIVVDGAIRDTDTLRDLPLPVYARWITPMAGTASKLSRRQISVTCGGVDVRPGEIVFGDGDGLIVASEEQLTAAISGAEEIVRTEARALEGMAGGRSLTEMLNVGEHVEAVSSGRESRLRFTE